MFSSLMRLHLNFMIYCNYYSLGLFFVPPLPLLALYLFVCSPLYTSIELGHPNIYTLLAIPFNMNYFNPDLSLKPPNCPQCELPCQNTISCCLNSFIHVIIIIFRLLIIQHCSKYQAKNNNTTTTRTSSTTGTGELDYSIFCVWDVDHHHLPLSEEEKTSFRFIFTPYPKS